MSLQQFEVKHIELPGGRIEQPEREFVVKVRGEYESIDELEDLVVPLADGLSSS